MTCPSQGSSQASRIGPISIISTPALVLSFIIAGLFWFSHHRRLTLQPHGNRGVVIVNLLFLLSIILLPVTNGLYGSYRLSSAVAVLYGLHLTVIAALNAWLWWLAARGRHAELAGAIFPVLVFLPGTALAFVAPQCTVSMVPRLRRAIDAAVVS